MSNVVHSHKPYGNDSVVCVWLGIKENKHNKVDNTVFLSRAKYKPKLASLLVFFSIFFHHRSGSVTAVGSKEAFMMMILYSMQCIHRIRRNPHPNPNEQEEEQV